LIPPILGAKKLYSSAVMAPDIRPPMKDTIGVMITEPKPKNTEQAADVGPWNSRWRYRCKYGAEKQGEDNSHY